MKYTRTSLAIAGAILLGTVGASAAAQTAAEPGRGYEVQNQEDEFPWGLLGLVGLAGLLGMKRQNSQSVRDESTSRAR